MSFAELQARIDAAQGEVGELAKSAAAAEKPPVGKADGDSEGEGKDEDGEGQGGADGEDAAGGAEGGDGGADGANADDDVLGKSFKLVLEDGTEVEAQDGAELVKAMLEHQASTDEILEKSVGAVIDMVADLRTVAATQAAQITSQAALIKSLQAELKSMGTKGSGRIASVTMLQKSGNGGAAPVRQKPQGMSRDAILAKAVDLQRGGQLTGLQVATVEADLNAGRKPAPEVLSLITGAAA